jgi:hypothetical protein
MILRSPQNIKMETYRRMVFGSSSLMGKGKNRGARNRSEQSPLPLSFPVEEQELGRQRRSTLFMVGHQRSLKSISEGMFRELTLAYGV